MNSTTYTEIPSRLRIARDSRAHNSEVAILSTLLQGDCRWQAFGYIDQDLNGIFKVTKKSACKNVGSPLRVGRRAVGN